MLSDELYLTTTFLLQDVMKNLEESARLHRAYSAYFDIVVVSESHDETYRQVMEAWQQLNTNDQWVPSSWVYS